MEELRAPSEIATQATRTPADAEGGFMHFEKRIVSAAILSISLVIPGFSLCAAQAHQGFYRATTAQQQHQQVLPTGIAAPQGLKALRRLDGGQRLDLAITLKLRHEDKLTELLKEIYDPASPNYRHYLSVQEFTEQFGPTVEDHEKVLAFARSNRLTVTHTSANRLVVDLNGAVEDIERSFTLKMQVYRHPQESRTFYAPDVEPSIDPSLPVQGIWGLSDFYPLRPAGDPRQAAERGTPQAMNGSGQGGTLLGSDLRTAYVPGVTLNGTGQAIGLFEGGPYKMSDIQGYFASEGQTLSVPILNVLLDGMNGVCGFQCDDTEEALDIDMALSLAPNLSAVVVYEGSSPVDILNQMATDNLAQQLSSSYVWLADTALYEPIFKEFAAQGQSFVSSSGDGGAYSPPGCSSNCWNSLFPADDPYVTAVGGTELTTTGPGGAWQSETAWPSSGGGINDYGYAIASYQAPLINALNQGSATLRNIPDVAAIASNVFVQANGAQGSGGGTSASAPVWASFMALVNQQANGSPVGFLNPAIYALAQTANYGSDFHDITTGNNDDSYSPVLFPAVAGYDLVTGLGSPNGQALINALAPANAGPNFGLQSSAPAIIVTQGGQATFLVTLQAANGFTGAVNLRATVVGQTVGVTASLSQTSISGAASSTVTISTTDGVSVPAVTVYVSGTSGGLTHSLFVPVTVELPNLVETAVSAPPVLGAPRGTFSVTDTVKNNGQAPAAGSVTEYYLSDATSKNSIDFPIGSRAVPALAAAASSTGGATVTVPATIWPNTPYYLLACANDTNAVAQATTNNCVASSLTMVFSPAQTRTTTSLAVTSSGAPASSVASGAVVTLTATVKAGTTPLTLGQVIFCDAMAAHCTDIHLLGTAQLTSSGTAAIKLIPAIGAHSYRAIFAGTTSYTGSTSSSSALAVTGTHATTTAIAESGSEGNYTLNATVTGVGGLTAPGGSVSFLDTSYGNASLGQATLAAGAASLSWLNTATPAVGNDPQGIATGDFNGDGIPDIAVANRNDGTVTILLGKGDGAFTQASVVPDVYSAQAIAVADFNGDGILDLAVANTNWGTVTILLGNGDGTFRSTNSVLSAGVLPVSVVAADFNGDGIPDLAVANAYSNTISIFLGNGDGSFAAGPVIALLASPQSLAVADFNGDGKLDLAVAAANPNNEMVQILLGNGDGSFTPASATLPVGDYPSAIVAADFNGDGKPDLAVTNAELDTVSVFLGNGDGTFTAVSTTLATGSYPLSLVTVDLNGDGKPDLAVANYGDGTLTILLGNGDGTFTAVGSNAPRVNSAVAIAAADFNGDGIPDFATADVTGNSASVLLTQFTQSATASLSGVNPSLAGNHLVDASYPGDLNYGSSASSTVTLTAGATPTVTVTPASSGITATQPLPVTVVVSGGLSGPTATGTVTLSSGNYNSAATTLSIGSAVITVPAGTLAVGNDTLTASYTPDANSLTTYSSATGTSTQVTVTQAAQTITFANPGTQTVGTPLTLSATATSGLAVTFTSITPTICAVSGTTATFITSGACTIDANQAGNSTYAAAPQMQQSFTVNSEAQTITFPAIAAQTVGTPLTLSATATSGLAVTFTSITPTICTVLGTTATFITSGTCTIDANQAGNSTYAAAPQVQQSFTVNSEAQTITFANPGTQTVGKPLTLSATATSGLAVTFTSITPTICTVSGTTATFIASGACTIDANQAGNSTYAAAAQVQQSFTVNSEAQTITFANPGTQTIGTPLALSATATSGLAVTFTSITPTICTVSGTTATFITSGACTIDANQAGNSTYAAAAQVQQSFTVNSEAQTITFANPGTQTIGTPLTLSATATSGLAVTFTSITPTICAVSGATATFITSGACTIDANQAGNSTYAAAPQMQQSFTVNSEAQTITFPAIAAQTVGTPLTLSATATSGLAVTFTSITPTICAVSGTTATFITSGACTIDANQAGNSTYAAAAQVQQSFTVNSEAQTITFPTIAAQTVGTPLTLSATATSGLAVTFTSITPTICTVLGTTATFIASGACTIDANQAGNSTYAAAAQVQQSFTVNAAPTFTGGGGGGSISIVPGTTTGNTVMISVTPSNGFTGTVNLSCSISPTAVSDPATCSLAPPSVTISGSTAQTSTLTINTTAATSSANQGMRLFWPKAGGAALALILFIWVPRRQRNWLGMLGLLVLFVCIGALGCGGGATFTGGASGGNAGTTPGSYTVTVTGTSGSLTVQLSTITVVVQ